jgi:hypothetical protein
MLIHRIVRVFYCFSACAVLALPATIHAQSATVFTEAQLNAAAGLRDRALRGTGAYEITASLATEIGPRLAGSEGDRAAVAWALTRLNDLGFENVRVQNVTVPRWVRGSIEAAITSPWPQPLVAVALGGSVGTSEEGLEADVLQVTGLDALRKLGRGAVEGRIVFINQRMKRTRDVSGYAAAVSARAEGAAAAAALGAVAVVIRSIGTGNNRLAHTGGMRYDDEAPRIPAAALSNPDADMLERQLASGRQVTLRLKLTARELPPTRSANVIGEIPGTDPDGEIVLLAAHLDSWDLGTGAQDDAAGVGIVLEAARLIRDMKLAPKRTLRVALFANEEFGLSGAITYASGLDQAELARHVVAMEADLGAGPVWRFDTGVAEAALPRMAAFAEVLQPLGIERGANDSRGGPDLRPLYQLGVPVLGLMHDATHYFDLHHTANDTLDKIDPKVLDRTVAAYAAVAYLATVMEGDFGRLGGERMSSQAR